MQDGATNDSSEIREIGNTPSSLLSDPIQLHMPMLQPMLQPMLRPTGALVNMWVTALHHQLYLLLVNIIYLFASTILTLLIQFYQTDNLYLTYL